VNGAHLNTVRPEYLLSIADYSKFLKLNPREENMKPKTIDRIFPYVSMDAWMTVVFQVLKIYYLNRVTPKSFKSIPGLPANETAVDAAMQASNIYSVSETVLLKWMQHHYNKVNPMHPKTLSNFDADMHDSLVFAAVIKSHYGSNSKNLKEMKPSVFNEEQVLHNAKKLIDAVHEIGLTTHLTP
jgi:Calponin homology (CH) domain